MTRIACYIQRSHSGASIVGIRLVAPGFDRLWTPSPASGSGLGAPGTGEGGNAGAISMVGGQTSVSTIHAAADWIAENLSALNTRELDTICVDPDGSVCTWLSAPSPEPKVIAATMAQLSLTDSDAASGAAGRLAMLSSPDPTTALSEISIQALAVAEPPGNGEVAAPKPARRKGGKTAANAPSSRFALLSIPDSPIRVLVDALDERSIQVGKVTSLWHAVASEFDPAARAMPGFNADHRSGGGTHSLVSASEVPSAILLLDPIGRLVWAWSLGGKLIAGGTMRLKRVAIQRETRSEDPFAQSDEGDPLLAGQSGLAANGSGTEPAEYDERFECSTPEVGRLVLDWLSWGAQLGQAPQRVICVGPQTVAGTIGSIVLRRPGSAASATPDPTHADPAPGFAEALAAAWPGATYDFLEHDDPIGLAMQRLTSEAVRGNTENRSNNGARTGGAKQLVDPRLELTALSTRPGRSTRSMYRWAALAVLAAAVVVIGLGYQLHRSADRATIAINAAAVKQKEAVDSVATLLPGIAASRNPLADLTARINEVRKQAEATNPPQPMIPELARLLTAFTEVRDKLPEEKRSELRITDISLNPLTAMCRLQVPDNVTGPDIEIALGAKPGRIRWIGFKPRESGLFILQGSPIAPGSAGNNTAATKPGTTATGGSKP